MKEIFALFNDKNELIEIGLKLEHVTSHLNHNFSDSLWNALFETDSATEQKKLLESVGYSVQSGFFNEKNNKKLNPKQADGCQRYYGVHGGTVQLVISYV